jgi:hypothetical protein
MPCTFYFGLNVQHDLLCTDVTCLSNVKLTTMVLKCYSHFQALHHGNILYFALQFDMNPSIIEPTCSPQYSTIIVTMALNKPILQIILQWVIL